MSDELFPVADVSHESPRLAWLKRHGVITFLSLPNDPEYRLWMAGLRRWTTEFTDCNATPDTAPLLARIASLEAEIQALRGGLLIVHGEVSRLVGVV